MPNRLIEESSPYLLQHKDNPVDWYPWAAEALLKSRAEDKPIFLSIGYSACHWCHVMEHESFENQQIADYLNKHFVCIKVDREERPDLDQIYMQAVMAMNGHGGWPLSAFLTPDQDFFFGGTYWPPTTTAQMPGFDRVLASVLDAYHNKRDSVNAQSKQITEMINSTTADEKIDSFDTSLFERAAQILHNRFDSTFGGFGSAPKFPHPMDLSLLLNLYEYQTQHSHESWGSPQTSELLEMVEVTLQKMADGGIFDHLAGGFARYSVDARWLVPHFEKMLYDNALLVQVFVHAFQITENPFYAEIVDRTLGYLIETMLDPTGAIYSTEDADSEGVEGKFYVWTVDEIVQVLGPEIGQRFCQLYDVTASGNFEGENILNLPLSFSRFAAEHKLDEHELATEMNAARQKLLDVRSQRIRPGLDDKVITSWNGLAIHAFADAAVVLGKDEYATVARNAGDFLWNHLRQDDGRLLHTWRQGNAKLAAYLDDYAYLINAFVSLYRVDFDEKWIVRASELSEVMIRFFHNPENDSFFFTASDHEQLIARTQEFQDSAVPSGNSMAATALIRLGQITGETKLADIGYKAGLSAVPLLRRAANAASQSLVAIEKFLHNRRQFVLVKCADDALNQEAIAWLRESVPLDEPLVVGQGEPVGSPSPSPLSVMLQGKESVGNQPTLYVCQGNQCELPVSGIEAIRAAVEVEPRSLPKG